MLVPTIKFFDDFTLVQPKAVSSSAETAMLLLLKILDWKVADSEARVLPFDCHFVSLGVQLSLDAIPEEMTLVLDNKPGRVEAIKNQAQEWLKPGATT